MSDDRELVLPSAPRLPDDTPSFEWMISDSIHTIASRNTPYREAARLFGDRYGLVLALTDAFRDDAARTPHLRRYFEVTRGLLARGKKILHDAWDERARPAMQGELAAIVREAVRLHPDDPPAPGLSETPAVGRDPFASTASVIETIDREPDRASAARQFATTWAFMRHAQIVMRELRQKLEAGDREIVDSAIRSAGRWILDLEEAWGARTFDELLGRPTVGELIQLVFPMVQFQTS